MPCIYKHIHIHVYVCTCISLSLYVSISINIYRHIYIYFKVMWSERQLAGPWECEVTLDYFVVHCTRVMLVILPSQAWFHLAPLGPFRPKPWIS